MLQVLQDGTFSRLGGQEDRRINIRVVSATNRDLYSQVQAGVFREDIFHRMNAFRIHLPPLRARIADLPRLVEYFLQEQGEQIGRSVQAPSRELMLLMTRYKWPGNIRELENMMRRYCILGSEDSIAAELSGCSGSTLNADLYYDPDLSLTEITKRATRDLERQIIFQVLQRNHWNRKRTAKMLRISYRSLFYKMREAGFTVDESDESDEAAVVVEAELTSTPSN